MQMHADLHVLNASVKASAPHTGPLFDMLQPEGWRRLNRGGFKVIAAHNYKKKIKEYLVIPRGSAYCLRR